MSAVREPAMSRPARPLLERNDGDCPRCVAGQHARCLDNPEEGSPCACAEGGHL